MKCQGKSICSKFFSWVRSNCRLRVISLLCITYLFQHCACKLLNANANKGVATPTNKLMYCYDFYA